MSGWVKVPDNAVLHIWRDADGNEVTVSPTFYADAGTPIDSETGDDMEYVRTEINSAWRDDSYARFGWSPADIQDAWEAQGAGREITRQEAEAWLERNAKYLQDRLVERGFEAIDTLFYHDDPRGGR